MKFNLQINPEWKVIDAKTGLPVTRVLWVDDETHDVARCKCALTCDQNPLINKVVGPAQEVYEQCLTPEKHIWNMPKVKLDQQRKTVLVNVDDAIKPEEHSDEDMPVVRRAILILA